MKMTKLLSLALAMAMVVAMAGCSSGEDTKVVATLNGEDVPAGVYIYTLISSYYNAYYQVEDYTKDVLKQQVEGMDAEDWIEQEALKTLQSYAVIESECQRLGLTLTDAELASVATSLNDTWENSQSFYESNGVARSSLELIFLNNAKSSLVYTAYYGADGEKSADPAEVEAYYNENYKRINQIVISKKTVSESGESIYITGQALLDLQTQSQEYISRLESGEAFETVYVDYQIAEAAKNGTEYVADELDETDLYPYDIIADKSMSSLSADAQPYVDRIFATEVGEVALYEDENSYVIFIVKDLNLDPQDFLDREEELNYQVAGQYFTEDLLALVDGVDLVLNNAAISRYTAKNLKIS